MDVLPYIAPIGYWLGPLAAVILVTAGAFWLIRRTWPDHSDGRLSRQVALIIATVVAIIIVLLVLPFDDETQGQLISLFGLVLTAVVALASTNFASNAMSGLMLKAVGSFKAGDFLRIDDHFGRVTEKSLLHTEIQTEDRDLVTLPNLYLISHPYRVVRSSGTLISCNVSLGYDVHRRRATKLLLEAGEAAELKDSFVQITTLGDFSINYRVSGFLADVENLVSKRTTLRVKVLDALHEGGVEIVSPNFMNQRPVPTDHPVMPSRYYGGDDEHDDHMGSAEKLMFDKAELASRIEKLRQQRSQLAIELQTLKDTLASSAENDDQAQQNMELTWRSKQIEALDALLANQAPPED